MSMSAASGLPRAWTSRMALPTGDIGQPDVHLAAESARSKQGLVKDVKAVGGGDDDDLRSTW